MFIITCKYNVVSVSRYGKMTNTVADICFYPAGKNKVKNQPTAEKNEFVLGCK